MAQGDFERMEKTYSALICAKAGIRSNLDQAYATIQRRRAEESGVPIVEQNRRILNSCGVTEIFEKIKAEQHKLLGCSDVVIEEGVDCASLSLQWAFERRPRDTRLFRKTIYAVIENDEVLVGCSARVVSRPELVKDGNLPDLVAKALFNAFKTE